MKHCLFQVNQQAASWARLTPGMAAIVTFALLLPLCAGAGVDGGAKCSPPIVLTEADNGGTVNVALNETFTLRLKSYSDGGYQWVFSALNTAKLRNLSHTVDTSGCPPQATGCSGDDVYTFKAIGTGPSTLSLVSRQSWNPDHPGASFSVTIAVAQASAAEGEGESASGVALTAADNGKTITVTVNEPFTLRLASGADGGYQWVVTAMDTAILEKSGHTVDTSMCAPDMMGCSGDDIFTFTPLKEGQSPLSLESRQSWDPDHPGATFSITVNVVPGGEEENGCERFLGCIGATVGTANASGGPGAGHGGDAAILGATTLLFMILGRKRTAHNAVR